MRNRFLLGDWYLKTILLGILLLGCSKKGNLLFDESQNTFASQLNQDVPAFSCDPNNQGKALPREMRRLSSQEYRNTLSVLLGSNIFSGIQLDLNAFPSDDISRSIKNFQNMLSDPHVTAIMNVAATAAKLMVADKANQFGSCSTSNPISQVCVQNFIRTFGAKVYRRPLAEVAGNNEVDDLYATYLLGTSGDEGLELLVIHLLSSPKFLFHIEEGTAVMDVNGQKVVSLTQFEIANRLSYAATSAPPDAQLLSAAANNQLNSVTSIHDQVKRLLKTPQGQARLNEFFDFWLQTSLIPGEQFSPAFLAGLDATNIRSEMITELRDFTNYIAMNGQNYKDLMTSKAVFPTSSRMASIYGTSVWSRGQAPLFTSQPRSGLLGRSAILMQGQDNSSPILRGVKLRKRLLCDNLPLPSPADIADRSNQVNLDPMIYTLRERVTELTKPPACMACHTQINPLGFALGHFDALGRLQSQERYIKQGQVLKYHNIDSQVVANISYNDGQVASNLDDMSQLIARSLKGPSCYIQQVHRFTQYREENPNEGCILREIRDPLLNGASLLDVFASTIAHSQVGYKEIRP